VRLLLDQNLSRRPVDRLAEQFPRSAHVRAFQLAAADDLAVWDHAKLHGFAIVSKDADFRQRSFLLGHPPKVVWVRLGNASTEEVLQLLLASRAQIEQFGADRDAAFLVLP
jgi:predicted nuclease of predicted toxin-antitoxin system